MHVLEPVWGVQVCLGLGVTASCCLYTRNSGMFEEVMLVLNNLGVECFRQETLGMIFKLDALVQAQETHME